MIEKDFVYLFLVGNCFIFSIMSFIFSIMLYIKQKAFEQSTHTIEFRDPTETYDDELILEKDDKGKVSRKDFGLDNLTHSEEDYFDEEGDDSFKKLNKEIYDDKVII